MDGGSSKNTAFGGAVAAEPVMPWWLLSSGGAMVTVPEAHRRVDSDASLRTVPMYGSVGEGGDLLT